MNKKYVNITIVSFIIGFMLFVQYNTVQNPTVRDTKDIWEIRNVLAEEQKKHSNLLNSIQEVKDKIKKYESGDYTDTEQLLKETVEELKMNAGVESVKGPGLIIKITPAEELIQYGYEIQSIPPMLINRLVNELNRNKAKDIEIGGQRISVWSAIRDINGKTTINSRPISKTDVEIKVITHSYEDAEKLYNYLLASSLVDDFYIDNLSFIVNEAVPELTIKANNQLRENTYLKQLD